MNKRNWIILIGIIALLLHPAELWQGLKTLLSFFIPFYIGFGFAYILNPILHFIEEKLLKKTTKPRLRRALGLLITYALFVGLPGAGLIWLLPRLIRLAERLPDYYQAAVDFMEKYPILNRLEGLMPRVAGMTLQMGTAVINILIGLVLSVYLLHAKEKLMAQCKKLLYLLFRDPLCEKLLQVGKFTHDMTRHFIIARLLDSLIVAAITWLFMLIFRVPYGLLSALIIGLFNTIPYFGSWLGAIPPGIIIFMTKPSMLIPYLVYIVLLEQLDGNLIGPKLQGRQVGLSPLWVIFAVFLFGGLFGFAGMVVGVPFFAVIYYFATAAVNNGLHRKGKSSETADYAAPEDREIITKD
ncbi:MAG: AI-2E family transporter [Clostridia bacterium]|nr:AI-2E family transporter [Clostridia bacterium]